MKKSLRTLLKTVLILFLTATAMSLRAAVIQVINNSDSGPGSLRAAIASASVGDTVNFATNLSGATITLNSVLTVAANLTIDASGLANGVTLSGNNSTQVILVNSGVIAVLNSLTITQGANSGNSGNGGGIDNEGGTVTLNQCTVSGNSVGNDGGGIYDSGTMTLNQCTLSSNSAPSLGGGIFISLGTMTLNECTLAGNSAAFGGGAWNNSGTLTLNQCTMAGNSAQSDGGGIYNGGTLVVSNSIVATNSAPTGRDIYGGATFGGSNIVQSVTFGMYNGARVTNAPNLAPLGNYGGPTQTMPPLTGSPAIDLGSDAATSAFATDQRGYARLSGAHVDIGAVEVQQAFAVTQPATQITPSSAQLHGRVTANDLTNTSYIEYGPTSNSYIMGSPTTVYPGRTRTDLTANLTGLAEGTTYHYQVVANDGVSLKLGGDVAFTTQGPPTSTNFSPIVFATAGTLTASINPVGAATQYYFEYSAPGGPSVFTATNTLPADFAPVSVSAAISGLTPGTTYQYELVASNSLGTYIAGVSPLLSFTTGQLLVVTNSADNGAGSLRATVSSATAGATITFTSTLSGTNILLSGGAITLGTNLSIDASALPNGIMINGGASSRIFQVNSATIVTLNSLTITNGFSSGDGGGIVNNGTLTLSQCTVSSNSSAMSGAGIDNTGTLTLNQCTVSGNSAYDQGGGISSGGALVVSNSIVAANISRIGSEISGDVTFGGSNIVPYANGTVSGPAPITSAPHLAPLGNYGGPTQTMPPLPGSPAIDLGSDAATNTFATDQRGYPRLSGPHVDIGAVELQQTVATTLPASVVIATTARLNGAVTANDLTNTWYFQYGPTTNYGNFSPSNTLSPGFTLTNVSAALSNLIPGATYHYQILANDGVSVKAGGDLTFTNVLSIVDSEIVVAITAPANNLLTTRSNLTVEGTMRGSASIPSAVQIILNNNPPAPATLGAAGKGAIPWSCSVTLMPGANVITAESINTNTLQIISVPVSRTVFYDTNQASRNGKSVLTLSVAPTGSGKISGQSTGAMLETNKVYTVTAAPAAHWLFSDWTVGSNGGEILSYKPALSFLMTTNLILQANFVTNPFPTVAGVYDGLFSPATGVSEATSGFLTVALTAAGGYTGKLKLDGGTYSFSGAFNLSGNSEATVARAGKPPVEVILRLNLPASDDLMSGYVINFASNGWTSDLLADRAVFSKTSPTTNYVGHYTMVLEPGSGAPTNMPGGYGYATLANTSAGVVTLGGLLADNATISQSVPISKNGDIPLYVSLYGAKGSLQGWLLLSNNSPTNLSSPVQLVVGDSLTWIKPKSSAPLYPAGFTNTNAIVIGSLYTNHFTMTSGVLTLGVGSSNVISFTNVSVAGNKLLSSNSVTLGAIAPATGIVTLGLKATDTTPKITAKGVLLEYITGTNAAGWFPMETSESGYFLLQP